MATLSQQLAGLYGNGWNEKTIRHCLRIAETFPEEIIVSAAQRQLGWTHLKTIMYLKDDLQRQFYMEMCILYCLPYANEMELLAFFIEMENQFGPTGGG